MANFVNLGNRPHIGYLFLRFVQSDSSDQDRRRDYDYVCRSYGNIDRNARSVEKGLSFRFASIDRKSPAEKDSNPIKCRWRYLELASVMDRDGKRYRIDQNRSKG